MIRRRPLAAKAKLFERPEQIASGLSGVLLRGLRDALRQAPMKASARNRLVAMQLIEKEAGKFSRLTPRGLEVLRAAQGMAPEGRGREGGPGSSELPSPVGSADAPKNVSDSSSPSTEPPVE